MEFINDSKKTIHWWNRNYFFISTMIIIAGLLLIFNSGIRIHHFGNAGEYEWYQFMNLSNFIQNFINCFFHSDWAHVIFNSVSMLVCGLYLERKCGSIPLLVLTFFLAVFASAFVGSNELSTDWVGFSVVIFAFYGFIFVDFFFSLKKERRTKFNIVWGIIFLVLIYLIMSINTFDGDWFVVAGREVGMTWYPHELLYNGGHYTGFLAGALICLLMELRLIYFKKSHNK